MDWIALVDRLGRPLQDTFGLTLDDARALVVGNIILAGLFAAVSLAWGQALVWRTEQRRRRVRRELFRGLTPIYQAHFAVGVTLEAIHREVTSLAQARSRSDIGSVINRIEYASNHLLSAGRKNQRRFYSVNLMVDNLSGHLSLDMVKAVISALGGANEIREFARLNITNPSEGSHTTRIRKLLKDARAASSPQAAARLLKDLRSAADRMLDAWLTADVEIHADATLAVELLQVLDATPPAQQGAQALHGPRLGDLAFADAVQAARRALWRSGRQADEPQTRQERQSADRARLAGLGADPSVGVTVAAFMAWVEAADARPWTPLGADAEAEASP